jgi:hypothetical protein
MANPFDALNQGLERLSTSPLGMAGLGLLMQPSQSLEPINPWEYAARGMQMGIQNRRTQQEDKRRAEEYALAIEEYNRKKLKYEEEKARKEQEQRALDAAMANLPPEQIPMARVLGKDFLKMQLENSMKPPQQTNLERNLIAAGLQPGTPAFQDAMMKGIMRPSVQIGTPEKPFSPSDLSRIEGPGGETPPIGMTPEQARQGGYRVRQNPPTDTQSVSAGFYSRMAEANAQMDQNLEGILASGIEKARADVPLIGNYTASDAYQVATNLMLDFVTANLRKESGAALGKEETEREFKKYFPQPGDGPKNIERKRQARQLAIESMRLNAGRAAQGRQPTIKQSAPVRNETDFQERLRKYVPGVR